MARADRPQLRLVLAGDVDHGKSTLVGRLLHDTGSLPPGKTEAIRAMCERRGMPFEWAFVMDAFQSERDQGITIDTTQVWFRTPARDTVIIDAPGHRQFLKNMVTGAALADAALLVVDAGQGLAEQSRRHGYVLDFLGIRQIVVAVNKMDTLERSRDRFDAVERDVREYLKRLGLAPAAVIPVSAREGHNVVERGPELVWYEGPTLVEALESLAVAPRPADQPLRLPIQDVYKFDDRRILVGRVESGRLRVGDRLLFSPANTVARVATLESWPGPAGAEAGVGQVVGLTLDEPIFVERGILASHLEQPPMETDVFRARLFWLGRNPLVPGAAYTLRLHTSESVVTLQSIERVFDVTDLSAAPGQLVERDGVADVTLRSRALLALDPHGALTRTGRFVLVDGGEIVGGGLVSMEGYADQRRAFTVRATNVQRVEQRVTEDDRARRNGHRGGVLWFTGLSGAGKSTLAVELEWRLFQKGYQVYILDGDNLRGGLNADLAFSPADRAENIRRAGAVASLFANAGFVVIGAFISPYRADRARARQAAPAVFHEVYVQASLATCERRDPKGLYRRAHAGEIREFTGVSAPYEPPETPELVIDTDTAGVDECVETLVAYAERAFKP
jgi:bifunctional enzyme CysN/CysC